MNKSFSGCSKFIKTFVIILMIMLSIIPMFAESQENNDVQRVEEYLNDITNVVSDFIQIAPDGEVATGKFYLSRPGKLRWQYDPPVPITIVANGSVLAYYDYELDQVSHVSVNSTLAGFLTRGRISFSEDVEVVDAKTESNVINITVQLKGKPEEGRMKLIFSDNPIVLKKMETVDTTGKTTNVSLNNPVFGTEIDEKVFILPKPKS